MKPLIPYGRKSSKEDPRISRERQESATTAWAAAKDIPLAPLVWEPHVSGSKHWRERQLGEAIAACERGEAAGIVVEEQSRLSRENQLATAEVWEAFAAGGFRLVCINDGLDTDVGDQELNFALRAAMAREQWKQYARRVEHAKKNAVERGVHISGKVPFGYSREKGEPLTVDTAQARLVRRAFKMRAGKATLGEVQRFLVKETGLAWQLSRVTKMLRNRVYLGEARQGKHVNPNGHTALVSQGVFDVVQAKFKAPTSNLRSDAKHLLAGIVRCSSCGHGMARTKVSGRYFVYRCPDRTGTCPAPTSIMAEALEEHVRDAWRARIDVGIELEASKRPERDDGREELLAELGVARNNRTVYLDPKVAGRLGASDLAIALDAADAEIERLEDELAQRVNSNAHEEAPDPTELRRLFDEGTTNEQRELLAGAIEAVTISRAPRGTALGDRLELHWVGENTAPARPSRGRPRKTNGVEVEAGVLAA